MVGWRQRVAQDGFGQRRPAADDDWQPVGLRGQCCRGSIGFQDDGIRTPIGEERLKIGDRRQDRRRMQPRVQTSLLAQRSKLFGGETGGQEGQVVPARVREIEEFDACSVDGGCDLRSTRPGDLVLRAAG